MLFRSVWQQAFDWLKALPAAPAEGRHELRGADMYAMVMRYRSQARLECAYESHRRYLDLQYTIQGSEIIDHQFISKLKPAGDFDEKKDLIFYKDAPRAATLRMLPGCFTILYPCDGHRPKVQNEVPEDVFKLVIKIDVKLLAR